MMLEALSILRSILAGGGPEFSWNRLVAQAPFFPPAGTLNMIPGMQESLKPDDEGKAIPGLSFPASRRFGEKL